MRYTLYPQEKSIVISTFLGGYRITLLSDETVKVEVPISNDEWILSRFTPWHVIIPALQEIVKHS